MGQFGDITGELSFADDGQDIRIEDFAVFVHSAEEGYRGKSPQCRAV